MTAKTQDLPSKNTQLADRSTRLLLALWGSEEAEVLKGKLTDRLKRKGEKSSDYKDIFEQLKSKEAIKIVDGKVAISNKGIELLGQHLKTADLVIDGTIVGAWVAKALCKWVQHSDVAASTPTKNGKVANGAIASYEEFKPVALETFDRLNQDYNMGDMVPIYRIRREIGDLVSRSQFNEWLFEMQSESLLQLLEESVEDSAPDKIEDSVTTKLGMSNRLCQR
ncbi:MAG TPA: hypothetical protein IGS53_13385 [Leptolyngbyaceae cyanobacterium M33_DOE_097]|uniref:Uncharacterized protein n=1 Tax=Oscillatoriales cyanobacterium SpSt-418 TaxID=2282169 RepID=A0A7C3KFN7_9CYAN|nr:hypothetical protein [Leptolyngbyaceae cyanobacterium M33_DOE_097]